MGKLTMCNVDKKKTECDNRSSSKMYKQFTTNGHNSRDMLIYGVEQVFGDDFTLEARER